MSLVIIKVDRTAKTHSIYSDGMMLKGNNVYSSTAKKITHIENDKFSILLGCVGNGIFSDYVRIHFQEILKSSNILEYLADETMAENEISSIFKKLWLNYCKENEMKENSWNDFGAAISINGYLFVTDRYQDLIFHSIMVKDDAFCTMGENEIAAKYMLYNNLPIQQIFDTISRYNSCVNNNVRSIENVSYLK